MHNYNNINIVSDDSKYQEICWFHTLEGIWHPVEVETSPLNITFNKDITPNYVCTLINEDSRKIILSNVDKNIIIEMILINSSKNHILKCFFFTGSVYYYLFFYDFFRYCF